MPLTDFPKVVPASQAYRAGGERSLFVVAHWSEVVRYVRGKNGNEATLDWFFSQMSLCHRTVLWQDAMAGLSRSPSNIEGRGKVAGYPAGILGVNRLGPGAMVYDGGEMSQNHRSLV